MVTDEWNALSEDELLVRPDRTFYYYINHRPNPNSFVDIQRRKVIAQAAIAADQEITLDYLREPLPKSYLAAHGLSYLSLGTSGTQWTYNTTGAMDRPLAGSTGYSSPSLSLISAIACRAPSPKPGRS